MKKCKYLRNCKSYSYFEQIFDPHGSKRFKFLNIKIFKFCNFGRPCWTIAGNGKILAKHKNDYILRTVRDRAISAKCFTLRASRQSSEPNVQKNFIYLKNGDHFEFFAKIAKPKKACISKTVRDRAILTESFDP